MQTMLSACILALVVTSVVSQGILGKIPSGLTKCRLKDSDLSGCVIKALNALKSLQLILDDQIKLPALDPFIIPTMHIMQDSSMANFSVTGTNFTLSGLKTFDIKALRYDPETMTFHGSLAFGPVSYESGYDIKGHLVSIPLEGKGIVHVGLGSIKVTLEIPGEMTKLGNVNSYIPKDMKVNIVVDDQTTHFDGLFGDNTGLANMANEMLKANSKLVAEAVTPVYERLAVSAFTKPIQSMAKLILHNEILPGLPNIGVL